MTLDEVRARVARLDVPSDAVVLGHCAAANEAWVLCDEGSRWSVYYAERGGRTAERRHPTLEEAAEDLLTRLARVFPAAREVGDSRTTYYLSSLESTRLAPVRQCHVLRVLAFDNGKPALLVRLQPPLPGQELGEREDVGVVVLAARHRGASVDPVAEFPCFVHVAVAAEGREPPPGPVSAADLTVVGWGELYRTAADAAANRFE